MRTGGGDLVDLKKQRQGMRIQHNRVKQFNKYIGVEEESKIRKLTGCFDGYPLVLVEPTTHGFRKKLKYPVTSWTFYSDHCCSMHLYYMSLGE